MAAFSHDIATIEQVLCQCAQLYATPEQFRTLMAFDHEHGQFVLIDEGWEGYRHIHQMWAHVELRDGRMWIHEDGTEIGIATLLKAAGVPRDRIVLAFNAPVDEPAIEAAAA